MSRDEQAKEVVRKSIKKKMKDVHINVVFGLLNTEQGS